MNLKPFLVDVLGAALELSIGTPDDVLRHVTPDVLSLHLPRPLWARLITACLGAGRVDAALVVETIGVANLCEHIPSTIIWVCLAEMGARSLGAEAPRAARVPAAVAAAVPPAELPTPLTGPPPDVVPAPLAAAPPAPPSAAIGTNIPTPGNPLADLISEMESDDRPAVARGRSPTQQRFRPSGTGIGRGLGASGARRPQAAAPAPAATPASGRPVRRGSTEVTEVELDEGEYRRDARSVDDSQLVDWQASDETQTKPAEGGEDFSDFGRKR